MAEVPPLEKLWRQYRDRGFEFFIIYVREAHPGENIPHHTSFQQKLSHASRCRDEENISLPILVDDLNGQIHREYGLLPNMIYVINRQGIIVYKSDWTDAEELSDLFENMIRWEEAREQGQRFRLSYAERLRIVQDDPAIRRRVYERAGQKAIEDYKRATGKSLL